MSDCCVGAATGGIKLAFCMPIICDSDIMVWLLLVLGGIRPDWFVIPVVSPILGVIMVWRDRFDLGLAVFSKTAGPSD